MKVDIVKLQTTALTIVLIASVFTGCSHKGVDVGNLEAITVEDLTDNKPSEDNDSLLDELGPTGLSIRAENQIKQALIISFPQYSSEYIFLSYIGTYSGADIVYYDFGIAYCLAWLWYVNDLEFSSNIGTGYCVWKDGSIYGLQNAYNDGSLTIDEIQAIYDKCILRSAF